MASCLLSCRSLRHSRMSFGDLTYPYPLLSFFRYHFLVALCSLMTTAITESRTIPVSGMTCAGCSSRIQRVLENTPGVSTANVNLMTGSATIEFDPSATNPEHLVEVIRETGYGAELPTETGSMPDVLDQ